MIYGIVELRYVNGRLRADVRVQPDRNRCRMVAIRRGERRTYNEWLDIVSAKIEWLVETACQTGATTPERLGAELAGQTVTAGRVTLDIVPHF